MNINKKIKKLKKKLCKINKGGQGEIRLPDGRINDKINTISNHKTNEKVACRYVRREING